MSHVASLIVALKTITLVLGGVITFLGWKAFRRTGSPALRSLTLGFSLVTLGAILAGAADQLLAVDTNVALVVESSLTAVGFGVIVYSLYVDR
ncbi:MAG: hypothetical protein U5J98_11285 [Halobacteriales archaeon]|nr:hypothetical protein [Halobacteriales archaeon]